MADPSALLTRDAFRQGVFARDRGCVICHATSDLDAHHVLNRRLWADGGYRLDNGVSLCPTHHLDAEHTLLSVETLHRAAGITQPTPHDAAREGTIYDTWGNAMLPDGTRLRGEMFFDHGAQASLRAGVVLPLFASGILLPSIRHLPWSHVRSDDIMIASLNAFQDADVVMTIADGGTTFTLTRESLRGPIPESARLRRIQASVPEWWSICMQAARTPVVLSVWDDQQRCLPWDETVEWAEMLDLAVPDVVYRGIWEEKKNRLYLQDTVVRRTTGFGQREWRTQVAQCRISKP